MAILKTEDLTYQYSIGTPFEKTAVDHVNLEIEEGAFVGIIGHTGSGKSTLIQHFNGLIRPTSGKIYLDGTDIWADKTNIRQVRFQVGLVFQYPEYQIFEDTVYKDIAFGPRNMGLSEAEIKERVEETAALVGLTQAQLNQSPFDLSGGQKRRVAIAGVMATESFDFGRANGWTRPERQRRYSSRDSPLSQGNRKNGSAGFSQHGRYGKLCRKNSGDECRKGVLL